ncbi:MAG: peptidase [Pedosphaera sp.]|nr:peptidase [Pedosphaera sp.]
MKIKKIIPSLLTVIVLAGGLTACMSEKESESDLKAQAKVSEADAKQTALSKVPNGTIKEGELEKEKGRLIWSFDIAIPGSADIKEVAVDAISGAVVSVETETAAQQAKEKAEDAKKEKKEKDDDEKDEKK